MDFGLKDIGLTFLIGTLTILGLDLILYYLVKISLTGFYSGKLGLSKNDNSNKPHRENLVGTSGFILLSFSVGVIVEDVSYKFMDPSKIPFFTEVNTKLEWLNERIPIKIKLLAWFQDHDKQSLRYNILVSEKDNKVKPEQIGRDLARLNAFTSGHDSAENKIIYNKLKGVEKWFLSDLILDRTKDTALIRDIREASVSLYYTSKNYVFLEHNYYDEMKKIQNRLDLSRSIVVISFIYLFLAALVSMYAFFRRDTSIRNYLAVFITLILAHFFSKLAYDREAEEFNKRAYVYYSTLLHKERAEIIASKNSKE